MYMPALGQFSLNRRTKVSNFSEVGQIRISRGTSTKIRTTPVTLRRSVKGVRKGLEKARDTDRQMIEKMISREAWKIFAIPSAMQTNVNKVVKRVERVRMQEHR
jgi:hypothetical protein